METKHTPGPWQFDEYGRIVDQDGEPVETCGLALFLGGSQEQRDESHANARLIAAAPELLAAAQWMVREQEKPAGCGDINGPFDAILAAIAKATNQPSPVSTD